MESIRHAVRLAPENAAYHSLLAEHMEGSGQIPDAELLRAVELSPLEARYLVRLGFRQETERDFEGAERSLLRAAAISRQFEPAWALMNYYFRRGDEAHFWPWMRNALATDYGEMAPVFKLGLEMTGDPEIVRSHLPGNPACLRKYLEYLLAWYPNAAGSTARQLASAARPEDKDILLDFCDRFGAGNAQDVISVWNAMCLRGLLPFEQLRPEAGPIVTNGNFNPAPGGRGFDWRVVATEGVSVSLSYGAGISVVFSGSEPEDCTLLKEFVPVTRDKEYEVHYEVRSEATENMRGIRWEIEDAANGSVWASSPEFPSGTEWSRNSFRFTGGSGGAGRLALRYKRPPGIVRAAGTITIRGVAAVALQ